MEGYLSRLFAVTVVVTVCSLSSYKGGKAAKFALAVLLVYTALSPLSAISEGFGGLAESEDFGDISEYEKTYEETAEAAFCSGIDSLICSEMGLDSGGVRVFCRGFDFKKMRAELVTVVLSGRCVTADSLKIKKLVSENGLGECEVEIEIG